MLIVSAAAMWFLARRAKPHRERQLVELVGQEATFQVIAKIPSRIWVDLRLKQACGRKAFLMQGAAAQTGFVSNAAVSSASEKADAGPAKNFSRARPWPGCSRSWHHRVFVWLGGQRPRVRIMGRTSAEAKPLRRRAAISEPCSRMTAGRRTKTPAKKESSSRGMQDCLFVSRLASA